MSGEKVTVTRIGLSGLDLLLFKDMMRKVDRAVGRFAFSDITGDNLNSVAWEANQVAKQALAGHLFLNREDNCLYAFSYMKIHVDKLTHEVIIKPCFTKEVDVFAKVKG